MDPQGSSIMDTYNMVMGMIEPPRTDWDEVYQLTLRVDSETREEVLQEELRKREAETEEWMQRSDDLVDRAARWIVFGQNAAIVAIMASLVIGLALIFVGWSWAAVPVIAVPVATLVVLNFRLSRMQHAAIDANSS